ncbi:uncharacterized protein EI90DRAFT_5847 [Cantharellus anzutake]|uniref:uncharacterized protein n=1 Tax=Cantharellus anzutake TaxID=1750568 RepID=UPI001904173F|nr:uncharacterized protein EI90DRAFT_5847 [Cantharellus anzutake]KAF8343805.1 hypothetical protein EI90DRAFT_5847 [Cantharellus anzutake]
MVPPDLPIDHHRSHVSIATSEEDRDRSSSPPPYMSPGTAPSPRMVALEDPGTRPEILGPRSFKQEINGVETSKEQTLPSQSRLEISSNTPTTCIPAPSLQHPPWLLGLLLELSEVDSRNLVGKITQHEVLKGHGSFGKVYQGVYKGEIVCVKVLKEVRTSASEGVITKFCRRMMREVKVWSTLRHSNVVTFHGWTVGCSPETDVTCAKLISAWCEGGNVGEYLRKTPNADRRRLGSSRCG